MDDDNRQLEFPPLQTHSKRFEHVMIVLSIALHHRGAGDRARHRHRQRVPARGLDRLTTHPVPSEAVENRPVRVRLDPPRRIRPGIRCARPSAASPPSSCWSRSRWSRPRAASSRRCASTRSARSRRRARKPASRRERTQIRLVRQGLNAHPFWAVSFSVPAPSGDGYDEADDRAGRREHGEGRGRQPRALARLEQAEPAREPRRGRRLEQQRGDDRERDDGGEPVDVRHAQPGQHADERRGDHAGLPRPAEERDLAPCPARAAGRAACRRGP